MRKDRYDSATFAPRALLISTLAIGIPLPSLIVLSTCADAATFDKQVRAPEEITAPELRERVRSYFYALDQGSTTMSATFKSPNEHKKLVDTKWHLYRAIDERKPLGELAEYGLVTKGDGTYSVDMERHPYWRPLDVRMRLFFAASPDAVADALKRRGFRDSDVSALMNYLNGHDQRQDAIAQKEILMESFKAGAAKRAATTGGRIDRTELMALQYQSHQTLEEASRKWVVGVLNSLDPQRQRILESCLMELKGSMNIAPGDPEANLQRLESVVLTGEAPQPTIQLEEKQQ